MLVEAAAGGVGTLLVQLAVAAGATVVAAAGGARKLAVASDLGAHELLDYRADGWAEAIEPVDVVFDGVGGAVGRAAYGRVRRGGRMVSYGLASGSWAGIDAADAADRGVELVSSQASPAQLRACTEQALASDLRPVIGQRFPLEDAAAAHAAIESRSTIGKTLLVV